jgi:hypothetical protein
VEHGIDSSHVAIRGLVPLLRGWWVVSHGCPAMFPLLGKAEEFRESVHVGAKFF